jgi:hypothetical protein
MTKRRLYKITFLNQGKVYEIYAREVNQGGLLGFVEVEGFVFGQSTRVVVDPAEEQLRAEFEGVRRSYIPMNAILRIDEVEKPGPARISDAGAETGNLAVFPLPVTQPGSGKSD